MTQTISALNILTHLPPPILVLNKEGRIDFVNLSGEEFFATSRNILIGKNIAEQLPFGSPLIGLIEHVIQDGHSASEYALDLGTPRISAAGVSSASGNKHLVDVQLSAVGEEETQQVLLIIQPRSIALKIDQQVTHRGAVRSVSGMAAMLAHEIKNPLSGIRGAAQLLESDLGEPDKELTRLICRETDRIASLVDEFEIFTDRPKDFSDDVNIHSVLKHVSHLARTGFAENINLKEIYDPSLPPLKGNKDQLVQVFLNLVKNAAEAIAAAGRSGEITLQTAYRPGVRMALSGRSKRISLPLEFSVIDNGVGVADDLKPIIFEPFVTDKSGGTGLGLALVAKIIGDHGGVIECDSQAGRTVFRILMPAADTQIATPSIAPPNAMSEEKL